MRDAAYKTWGTWMPLHTWGVDLQLRGSWEPRFPYDILQIQKHTWIFCRCCRYISRWTFSQLADFWDEFLPIPDVLLRFCFVLRSQLFFLGQSVVSVLHSTLNMTQFIALHLVSIIVPHRIIQSFVRSLCCVYAFALYPGFCIFFSAFLRIGRVNPKYSDPSREMFRWTCVEPQPLDSICSLATIE